MRSAPHARRVNTAASSADANARAFSHTSPLLTPKTKNSYGNSVTKSPDIGAAAWEKFATSWGKLQGRGFCAAGGDCQRFPVVPGEIGTSMKDGLDLAYYVDLAKFMAKAAPADAYASAKFNSWFWFCWNANSGDTGGLVDDTWKNLKWDKLTFLHDHFGLRGWWAADGDKQAARRRLAAAA